MKFKDYIILALIAVGLFLLWRGCHPKPPAPVQVTIKELIHDTVINNKALAKTTDSFNRELKQKDAEYNLLYKDFTILVNENDGLAMQIATNVPVPDTCAALNKAWQDKYKSFAAQTKATTQAANKAIQSLQGTVKTQKQFLVVKDSALAVRQRALADCIAGYKQAAKDGPRNEINAGVSVLSGWDMTTAPGVALGYRSKKGWQFDVGAYSNKVGTFTVRKTLFKWK